MDMSQHKKAQKTAGELMRVSAMHIGSIEELSLVEAAQFLLTQTDQIRKLQTELEQLRIENARKGYRRKPAADKQFAPFKWTKSALGL